MAKILILGANGQLGQDLLKVLNEANHQIIAYTAKDFNAKELGVVNTFPTDCKYIVNCVATTQVDLCEDEIQDTFLINSAFVVELAKFCALHNIILIHISTDYIFDGLNLLGYAEEARANPLNVYGLSKLAGEMAVRIYLSNYFVFRLSALFGVAGASGKGGNFITTMLNLAKTRDSWNVINDQITCPTHTLDVARVIKYFIDHGIDDYGIYNCVSSSACSWYQFACDILQLNNINPNKIKPISYQDYKFKAIRPQYTVLNVEKLSKYYQMPTVHKALQEYISLKVKPITYKS